MRRMVYWLAVVLLTLVSALPAAAGARHLDEPGTSLLTARAWQEEVDDRESFHDTDDEQDGHEADEESEQGEAPERLLTYESPQFGYTLTLNTSEWHIAGADSDPDDAYDEFAVDHPLGYIELIGDGEVDAERLDDCLDQYQDDLTDGTADDQVLDEETDEEDRAWREIEITLASEEEEEGDEETEPVVIVAYIECRVLDEVVVVVTQTAYEDDSEDFNDAREELLSGLDPEGADGGLTTEDLFERVETYDDLTRDHVEESVDYEQSPPVGGNHNPVWQTCGFYDEPVASEHAVHSMEHGAVWVTYDPDLSRSDRRALEATTEGRTHLLVSPYGDLPAPVVASAWGVQLELEGADDPYLELFIMYYEQGPQTPEFGATCGGGTDETTE